MKNAFVIATALQKGGTGKSTTAISLSIELSKTYDTVVVDLDKAQKSLTTCLLKRKRSGLAMPELIDINTAEEVKTLINTTKKVILIDVGGYDSAVGRMALLGADMILSPVSDSGIELDGRCSGVCRFPAPLPTFWDCARNFVTNRKTLSGWVRGGRFSKKRFISSGRTNF